jgi:hypothetical protein
MPMAGGNTLREALDLLLDRKARWTRPISKDLDHIVTRGEHYGAVFNDARL